MSADPFAAVASVVGSKKQAASADKATAAQTKAADEALALQERMYEQGRTDFAPYRDLGSAAAPKLAAYDQFQGVGDAVNYDREYTNQLTNYNEDPGVKAQKALGQQSLQRQLNARGLNYGATGASAGAELDQKFDVQGYDKYKSQLSDRYKALQGEYALRRDKANTGYQQLLDQVKIGQGAASAAGTAGSQYAQQGSATLGGLGNALAAGANAQGQIQGQFWSGLGGQSGQAGASALQFGQAARQGNWFGGGSTPATSYQGTMVESGAPAYSGSESAAYTPATF